MLLRALILTAMLGVAACGHDDKAPPHDPDAPLAAPIAPVQQEPLKPQ